MAEGPSTVVNSGLVALAQSEFGPDARRYGNGSEPGETNWADEPDPLLVLTPDPLTRLRAAVRRTRGRR